MSTAKNPFEKIEQSTNLNADDIYKIADAVKNQDLSDERTVRNLVKQLSKMANKPISKEKEDRIVKAITQNKMPKDMNSLSKFFK